jgi:large subunit ribosomal protein L9
MKTLDNQNAAEERRKQEEKAEAEVLAKKLEAEVTELKAKSGEGGRLFGAITSKQIAEALSKKGLKVDKRKIELDEPIRTLGVTQVTVKVHPEVKAALKVQVTEE